MEYCLSHLNPVSTPLLAIPPDSQTVRPADSPNLEDIVVIMTKDRDGEVFLRPSASFIQPYTNRRPPTTALTR
jgi:hypothetical protein